MTAQEHPARQHAATSVAITRIFDAPRAVVFRAWTDPQHVAQWWGPQGFTNPVCDWDARPGGAFRIIMRAPDGVEYPMIGVFREIVEPERLVFTDVAQDARGVAVLEALTTVTFAEHTGNTTKLTLQSGAIGLGARAAAMLAAQEEGWTQSLVRLMEHLAGQAAR